LSASGELCVALLVSLLSDWIAKTDMSIRVRCSESLDSDRDYLIALFRRHLADDYSEERFDWLYLRGPHGPAVAWIASDDANSEPIGAAAAFPRRIYCNGQETLGVVLGDFCMNKHFRSLGPSLLLQRACVQAALQNPFEFFYDFPSAGMMGVYKRLGFVQTGALVRWVKLLRAEAKLQSLFRSRTVAKVASTVANAALAQTGWRGDEHSCELELLQGRCSEEFTHFDEQVRTREGIQTVRCASYLNWRYLDPAAPSHQILTARRQGALVGYIVYASAADEGRIIDLNSLEEPAVIARLLAGAVQNLSASGISAVNLCAADVHPWSAILQRAGFRKRENSPIVAGSRPDGSLSSLDFQNKWYAMSGDRDS
jgi:hypothetical protein